MKKATITIIFLICVCALSFIVSCNKSSSAAKGNTGSEYAGTEENQAAVAAIQATHGFALRVNTGFYTIDSDTGAETDTAVWKASLALGEKVAVLSASRKAVYQDTSYDFTRISRDGGQEGYVITSNIALDGTLAVVIDENTRIYKSPKNVDVTNSILSRKTIAVYYPQTSKDGFVEFKAYDPVLKTTFTSNFIRLSALSASEADIQSSILMQTAEALDPVRDKNRIEALLESAVLDYPGSAFVREIAESKNAAVEIKSRPASSIYMYTSSDNVNVRDLPDAVNGKVVGQLAADTLVTCDMETVDTFTINNVSAQWYHITQPATGWVFGQWLVENE